MSEDVTLVTGEVVTLEEAQAMAEETGVSTLLLNGSEVPDPLPVAPPVGYSAGPDLTDLIRQAVAREIGLRGSDELDTADEAEDFDHPEAFEPFSAYEVDGLDRDELVEELRRRGVMLREKPAPDDAPGAAAPSSADPAGVKPASAPSPGAVPDS